MKVKCIVDCLVGDSNNVIYNITPNNIYTVIGIEANWYRIIGNEGEPYLYPPQLFEIVEAGFPPNWKKTIGKNKEIYCYPPEIDRIGFFEDYFDKKEEAIAIFNEIRGRFCSGGLFGGQEDYSGDSISNR